MINKLKKIYPSFLIFIKKDNNIYDIHNNLIIDYDVFNDKDYIIIEQDSYTVHKKLDP